MPIEEPEKRQRVDARGFMVRLLLLVLLLAGIYLLGDALGDWARGWLSPLKQHGFAFLLAAMLLYVIFMALPFVPGIEVGLLVMSIGGVEGVVLVYAATLLALSLSYGLGRLVPVPVLSGTLGWLGLRRAEALVFEMEEMTPAQRLMYLSRRVPSRWIPFLLRHRYVAVALILNTPGNAVIGGGGGIGLVAGMSGLFPYPRFLALVAMATLPVPLLLISRSW